MPQSIYTLAKGKSKAEAEKLWKQAIKVTKNKFGKNKSDFGDREYSYAMGVYKKSLGINESIQGQTETEGEKLIKRFGLSKLDAVYASRVLGMPYPVLHIVYDSHRQRLPLSRTYIFHRFNLDLFWGDRSKLTYTPFFDLKDYNGTSKMVYIVNDLAGSYLQNDKMKEKIEKIEKPDSVIFEFVTMADLMDKGNISDFSMDYRKDRNTIMGGENTTAKLLDVFLDEKDDSVTFLFQTQATKYKDIPDKKLKRPPADRYKKSKQRVQPLNLSLIPNPEKRYEIQIKVLEFFSFLDAQKENVDIITPKLIKEIMEVSNIQLFSSSPSFQLQGMNYWLTQIDGAISPENRKPQRWNKQHGEDYFLDKHLYGLIRQMKFFYNPMSSMLNRKLKNKGYI